MTTLTATSYDEAVSTVQAMHMSSYIYAWESCTGWDVAVYSSEDDFDADAEECSNDRMITRYSIASDLDAMLDV